jgi:RNA recognition motif-containing protein
MQNENPGSNIYIANLPRHATEEDLRERFAKFGKITEHKIVRDPYTKLTSHLESLGALALLNSKILMMPPRQSSH